MSLGVLITLIAIGLLIFIGYIFYISNNRNKVKQSDDDNYQDKNLVEQSQELALIQQAKKVDTSISKNEIFKQAYERNNPSTKKVFNELKDEFVESSQLEKPLEVLQNDKEEFSIPEMHQNSKNTNTDKFKEYSPEAIDIIERLSQQIKSINTQ